MQYFPRISPNSLKISPKVRASIQIQRSTYAYLYIKIELIVLHLKGHFTGFNLIYWTAMCGKYFLRGSILENVEKCGKTAVFLGGYSRLGKFCLCGYGRIGQLHLHQLLNMYGRRQSVSQSVCHVTARLHTSKREPTRKIITKYFLLFNLLQYIKEREGVLRVETFTSCHTCTSPS